MNVLDQDGFTVMYTHMIAEEAKEVNIISEDPIELLSKRELISINRNYDIDNLKAKGKNVRNIKTHKKEDMLKTSLFFCVIKGRVEGIGPATRKQEATYDIHVRGTNNLIKFKGETKKSIKPYVVADEIKLRALEDSIWCCIGHRDVDSLGDYIELIDPKKHKVKADSYLFVFDGSGTLNGNAIESFLYTDVLEKDEIDGTLLGLLVEK